MPQHLLTQNPQQVAQYAVLGLRKEEGAVYHVAVLRAGQALTSNSVAEVFECRPPIGVGTRTAAQPFTACPGGARCSLQGQRTKTDPSQVAVGCGQMTPDQLDDMHRLLHELQTALCATPQANSRREYRLHPPYEERRDQVNGRLLGLQCSCAGFVLWLYHEGAGRPLVDLTRLPVLTPAELTPIWSVNATLAARWGLRPDAQGNVAVLLPGYLLHALTQSDPGRPPYPAAAADRFFP